jgi:hypothetical protein
LLSAECRKRRIAFKHPKLFKVQAGSLVGAADIYPITLRHGKPGSFEKLFAQIKKRLLEKHINFEKPEDVVSYFAPTGVVNEEILRDVLVKARTDPSKVIPNEIT